MFLSVRKEHLLFNEQVQVENSAWALQMQELGVPL
jgi:hypothetical protein